MLFGCKKTNVLSQNTKHTHLPANFEKSTVVDLSNMFSNTEIKALKDKIANYETFSTNEIALLTIDSITPYKNPHNHATAVANLWGIGKKDLNNGLLMSICKPCKTVAIATGLGTEKTLTDSICKYIITTTLTPKFKQNEFYSGVDMALDSIVSKWH